jgi:hypothetical protein
MSQVRSHCASLLLSLQHFKWFFYLNGRFNVTDNTDKIASFGHGVQSLNSPLVLRGRSIIFHFAVVNCPSRADAV